MEWQPIETAPKDQDILLLIEGKAIQGSWDAQCFLDGRSWGPGKWDHISLPDHGCGCCSYDNEPATHWMPLPTPPEV
jgi:hypothetical protein